MSQSKQEEFCISNASELGPECLYFGIERFCRCICAPVYKIVQDRPIVEGYCVGNGIEGPEACILCVFVPMRQLCICRLNGSCRIEYVPESLDQVKGSLYIRVLIEQYPASFGLVPGPIVGRFIKEVPTSGQELFSGVPIAKFFWDEGPVLFFCPFYLFVLQVYGVPSMLDRDVLKGFQCQFLYVEPVGVTCTALGKHFLAMVFMEFAISRVISLTLALFLSDIFISCSMIGSTLVPENMATMEPFLPLAFLLVIMV